MPGFALRWPAEAGPAARAGVLGLARAVSIAGLLAVVPAAAPAQAPDVERALRTSQAAIGRSLDDFRFRDSTGVDRSLRDFRGKPLVVSFVYTGCFQACPVATQFLARAVAAARAALGDDRFEVVSIGFNQPFDSPAAMAAFARQNRIDDPRWRFLSPEPARVEALAAEFGFVFQATPKGFDHITQVSIVDADGAVYRQVYGENFDLPMLVGPLKELLSGQASRAFTPSNLWEKVKLYCTVYDPLSGGYRANYSLFFEVFAGLTTLGAIAAFIGRELRRGRRTAP